MPGVVAWPKLECENTVAWQKSACNRNCAKYLLCQGKERTHRRAPRVVATNAHVCTIQVQVAKAALQLVLMLRLVQIHGRVVAYREMETLCRDKHSGVGWRRSRRAWAAPGRC
jgi:hypothetical protein